jgi:hypothetical protein
MSFSRPRGLVILLWEFGVVWGIDAARGCFEYLGVWVAVEGSNCCPWERSDSERLLGCNHRVKLMLQYFHNFVSNILHDLR